MKRLVAGSLLCSLMAVSPVVAAELLEVNPVVNGASVTVDVTADIPMTYTYYKVPGQARAVVDIADADPEKVEPLIVVNKGAIASISVDKAMIADMTISRLVFNLVKPSDISVTHSGDRKKLTVSFGANGASATPATTSVVTPVVPAEPVVVNPPKKAEVLPVPAVAAAKADEDPLGLDEPKPVAEPAKVAKAQPATQLSKEDEDPLGLDEPKKTVSFEPARSTKLQPVVPAASESSSAVVKGIVVGASFIDIQTNGNVDSIKHMKLVKPDRLAVDIPGTSTVSVNTITVNKFGISKMRIGKTPGVVRIVLDATKAPFPAYTVTSSDAGVRISFK